MLRRRIRTDAAAVIVVTAAATGVGFSSHLADVKSETPTHKITVSGCVRCHEDDKTIRAMQSKSGDSRFSYAILAKEAGIVCPVSSNPK
jgi:hypothetical protein